MNGSCGLVSFRNPGQIVEGGWGLRLRAARFAVSESDEASVRIGRVRHIA